MSTLWPFLIQRIAGAPLAPTPPPPTPAVLVWPFLIRRIADSPLAPTPTPTPVALIWPFHIRRIADFPVPPYVYAGPSIIFAVSVRSEDFESTGGAYFDPAYFDPAYFDPAYFGGRAAGGKPPSIIFAVPSFDLTAGVDASYTVAASYQASSP